MKLLMQSYVNTFQFQNRPLERAAQPSGRVILLPQATEKKIKVIIDSEALPWVDVKASLAKPFLYLQTQKGPLWVVSCHDRKKQFTFWRDSAGDLVSQWQVHGLQSVEIDASQLSGDQLRAVAMGFELASYNYRVVEGTRKANLPAVSMNIQKNAKNNLHWELGRDLGMGMNVGRHLINHPGNILNPVSYSEGVKNYFQKLAGVKVTVLKGKDLEAGQFGLLQAVGAGSPNPPCLVHISYRPKLTGKSAKGVEPIAFVGKGITFDTGGLDIKISSSMRLMKKDMGGSASVIGLADFVIRSKLEIPCDFIIALAENSVDGLAMRPGDIIRSKSGQMVEIDNTDAEGRLVLADAMTYVSQLKEKPKLMIDVATLTGACRVALGQDIGGMMSNDSSTAKKLQQIGWEVGDYVWELPLFDKYFSSMNSHVADFKNSGDGFAGAITGGLFLQKFSHQIPWVHLDVYCWSDKTSGAHQFPGGYASGVSLLAHYLLGLAKKV